MSRLGKMPSWQRSFVICGMMTCSITGLMYLLGHQFYFQRSILGAHSILAAHGIAAILASLALGSVLPFHIKAGYKSRRQLWSGFSQLGFLAVLLISGALLYYGPEEIRDGVIDTHWIVGLLFSVIFVWHSIFRLHSKA
jgi:Na+/melibiose symporter-like transporter